MRTVVAVTAALIAVAAPAAAEASTTYFNGSSSNGGYAIKSGSTFQHFEVFCRGKVDPDVSFGDKFAFSLRDIVSIGKKGKFSYDGQAYRYGNERQAAGQFKVKVSGRVTSKSAQIKWTLPGCGSNTLTAARQ